MTTNQREHFNRRKMRNKVCSEPEPSIEHNEEEIEVKIGQEDSPDDKI